MTVFILSQWKRCNVTSSSLLSPMQLFEGQVAPCGWFYTLLLRIFYWECCFLFVCLCLCEGTGSQLCKALHFGSPPPTHTYNQPSLWSVWMELFPFTFPHLLKTHWCMTVIPVGGWWVNEGSAWQWTVSAPLWQVGRITQMQQSSTLQQSGPYHSAISHNFQFPSQQKWPQLFFRCRYIV